MYPSCFKTPYNQFLSLKALKNIQMDIYLRGVLPNIFQNNYCLYPVSDFSEIQLDTKIHFSERYNLVAKFYFG